jgi:hypothetical protein
MESETRPGAMVRVFRRIYLDLNLVSRGGKRAQTTPNIPKSWILGSRTKESQTPPVATSRRRGPTNPESYAPAQLVLEWHRM